MRTFNQIKNLYDSFTEYEYIYNANDMADIL